MLHPLRVPPAHLATSILILWCQWQTFLVQAAQQLPPNFFNHKGCLYVTTTDAGSYWVAVPDAAETQSGRLGKLTYDAKSACIDKDTPGLLKMNFETNDNNFASMSIEMQFKNNPKTYNWEVTSAILEINPNNAEFFSQKRYVLHPANGGEIYAPLDKSYSCSSLVLTNSAARNVANFKITLRRFQFQPFPEPQTRIFAPSRDCSSWLTLPQIMGFLLVLFMIFTVLIGAYLLLELGGHSSDLRFSKQGGMLMNQAQLDATKAD